MTAQSGDADVTVPASNKAVAARRRSLLVMTGEQIDVRPLPLSGEVTVGRSSTCDVRIDHPSISRTHLRIRISDEGLAVIDLGGSNGTSLRGVRLPAEVPVEVSA